LIQDTDDGTASDYEENNQPRVVGAVVEERDGTYDNIISIHAGSKHAVKAFTGDELQQDYLNRICTKNTIQASSLIARLRKTFNTILETLQHVYSPQLLVHTTLPLQMIWFSLSFGTYGITTWINTIFVKVHLQNVYFNAFLFALANLPGNIVSIMYSDKWGRKGMLVGSLIGAAGGLVVFAILVYSGDTEEQSNSTTRTYGIVLSACAFQMFSIVSWNAIDILTGELFPTRVRSAGMGVCTACGRFAAMFAQFVNARLMMTGGDQGSAAPASVLVVAASTLLVGAGTTLFLERDMALGELKDEITEGTTSKKSVPLGCLSKTKGQKDHVSDDEVDRSAELRSLGRTEYQSYQEEQSLI